MKVRAWLWHVGAAAVAVIGHATVIEPIPYSTFTLPNGVRVFVVENHETPVVAIQAFVNHTGGMREGRWLGCGVSHFVEHIAAAMLKDLGSVVNAYTTADHTCYHCETSVAEWARAAEAIGKCLHACPFEPAIVERERAVIVQEIRMGEEEPSRMNWYQLLETLFRASPQRIPVIGYQENVQRVTRDDLLAFYRERYAANNIVVAIAGAVHEAEARRVAERAFGQILRQPNVCEVVLPEQPPASTRVAVRYMPVEHARVILAWLAAPAGHKDEGVFDLFSRILAEGESSLLVDELRTRRQVVYEISAGTWVPWTGNAVFLISLTCDATNTAAAITGTLEILQKLAENPPDETLVARARRAARLEYARNTQSAAALAATVANNYLAYGDPQYRVQYLTRLEHVSSADVARVARRYCPTNAVTISMVLPAAVTNVTEDQRTRSISGSWIVTQLCNGVRVAIKPDMRWPVVEFCLYLPGGLRAESVTNNGISALCAALLTKGTRTRSAADIARAGHARRTTELRSNS